MLVPHDQRPRRECRETLANELADAVLVVLEREQVCRDVAVVVPADAIVIDVGPEPNEEQPDVPTQHGDVVGPPELRVD